MCDWSFFHTAWRSCQEQLQECVVACTVNAQHCKSDCVMRPWEGNVMQRKEEGKRASKQGPFYLCGEGLLCVSSPVMLLIKQPLGRQCAAPYSAHSAFIQQQSQKMENQHILANLKKPQTNFKTHSNKSLIIKMSESHILCHSVQQLTGSHKLCFRANTYNQKF